MKRYLVKGLAALAILTSVGEIASPIVGQGYIANAFEDDREQVFNITESPYSGIVAVRGYDRERPATGFVVGKNTVVTNKHVALRHKDHPEHVTIYALVGPGLEPQGGVYRATKIIPYPGKEDFVVMHVTKTSFGYPTRTLNDNASTLQFNRNFNTQIRDRVYTAGFPSNKPFGSMWKAQGEVTDVKDTLFRTNLYTSPGHSGSPIYDGNNFVVGILTGGPDDLSAKITVGVRFNQDMVDFIQNNISE